jgi:hypothetical protein
LKSISLEFGQAHYLTPEMDPWIHTPLIRVFVIIIIDFQGFLLSIRPRTFPGSITNEKGRVKNSLVPAGLKGDKIMIEACLRLFREKGFSLDKPFLAFVRS